MEGAVQEDEDEMSYVDVMLCAVPTGNKQAYLEHAERAAEVFKRHGATAVAECWGEDVPEGERNSMHTAVLREPDETVVASWVVWPSKDARDAGWEKIHTDPVMTTEQMPFDGARMIFGGFDRILDR